MWADVRDSTVSSGERTRYPTCTVFKLGLLPRACTRAVTPRAFSRRIAPLTLSGSPGTGFRAGSAAGRHSRRLADCPGAFGFRSDPRTGNRAAASARGAAAHRAGAAGGRGHLVSLRAAHPVLVPARGPGRCRDLHAPERLARTQPRHDAPRHRAAVRRAGTAPHHLLHVGSDSHPCAGNLSGHDRARVPAPARRSRDARTAWQPALLCEPVAATDAVDAF